MISPLNSTVQKIKINLVQTTESGVFFSFKNKKVPLVLNKPVYFIYDGITYSGEYGYTFQDMKAMPYIKNISNYSELELKVINLPGVEFELYDTFSEVEPCETFDNIFTGYIANYEEGNDNYYDFISDGNKEILLKNEGLLLDNENWNEIFRVKIDIDVLNPTLKYKFQLKDDEGSILSGTFNIISSEDVTVTNERYDFVSDRKIKLQFVFETYEDETYVVMQGQLPEFDGELIMESHFYLENFDSLYFTLTKELTESVVMTINKTSEYEIINPINGMKTFYTKSVVTTETDATNSNIFIDSVVLPPACTVIIKNGNLLFPTQYELNNPMSGFIGNVDLAENDTIQAIYSFVLKQEYFVIDNTMLAGVTVDGTLNGILLIALNGKILFPTEYTITGNDIELVMEENDTLLVLYQ